MAGLSLALPLALMACKDETISGWSDPTTVWRLTEIDGTPFDATATLSFPEEGIALGQGPCNSYRAKQSQPYPWIGIDAIAATRMACPALDQETAFFAALKRMTLAEASDRVLILTNDNGGEMVFKAEP